MQPEDTAPLLFESPRLVARWLAPGDEPLLQPVFEAAGDYFLTVTGRPAPDADAAEREIRACAQTPGRAIATLSLREGGAPVGAVGWWEGNPEPEVALVGMLLIIPEQRGKGLARETLGALGQWLAGRGVRGLRTGVGAGDQHTHALLRALGFEEMDQRKHVSLDRGRVMIALFEKPLHEADNLHS